MIRRSASVEGLLPQVLVLILGHMPSVRRTVSLPEGLASRLEEEAAQRGITLSALVVELARSGIGSLELPYVGVVDDEDDLSMRVDEVLARLAS